MEGVQSYFYTDNEISSMKTLLAYHNKRADGRDADTVRPLFFEFASNSAIVHLGKTLVSCVTTAEKIRPTEDRPSEGFHMLSLQSPNRVLKSFQTEALVQIRDCLHRTRALDLESLVIKIGEIVWCLKSDIVVLNNDGGLFEACNLAVIGSLLYTKLPGPRGPRPIVLHHLPIAATFGYLNLSKMPNYDRNLPSLQPLYFADPTYQESLALDGFLTIFANVQGEICAMHKNGGIPLSSFVFSSQTDSHVNMAIENSLRIAREWHVVLMQQMGDYAPTSLKDLGKPSNVSTTKDSSTNIIDDEKEGKETKIEHSEKTENRNIAEEVRQEFRKAEGVDVSDDDDDEEINPTLLALFNA